MCLLPQTTVENVLIQIISTQFRKLLHSPLSSLSPPPCFIFDQAELVKVCVVTAPRRELSLIKPLKILLSFFQATSNRLHILFCFLLPGLQ